MCDKSLIPIPDGTAGQNPQWPGDGHAPASNETTKDKDGTRDEETTIIPEVR
jgi:hypothetical protein